MWFFKKGYLVSILAGVISLVANQALAVTGSGASMKNSFPKDNSCLSTLNYGGITNNCNYSVQVVGSLQLSAGYHATSIYQIYGNNSWCQTVSINGVGNGNSVGPQVYTTSGPKVWQTLNLGNLYVYEGSGVIFRCSLEAGWGYRHFHSAVRFPKVYIWSFCIHNIRMIESCLPVTVVAERLR